MLKRPNVFFPLSKKKILLALLVVGGIALIAARERWLLSLGDFLIIKDRLRPADVIHVIAGEDYRTDRAILLYKQGLGKTIFFTGGWCNHHHYDHGEHGKERALAQGVPLSAIAIDGQTVTSTYAEAERLKEWISRRPTPVLSVIVVSDPFHMRRARWTYKRVLGDHIKVRMAPVPFESTPYQRRWWVDRASRRYVRDEYQKYFYYILRYQISRGKFRAWLASRDRD